MNNELDEFLKIAKANQKANLFLNKTIDEINEDVLIDAKEILEQDENVVLLGIKNTGAIDRDIIKNLVNTKKYIWHTIDKMSDGGRAIDIDLVNPITGKVMTGSSSATAINVLYGINDIGIGTDGGGSVLAPALSLNLFSVLAKGLGLKSSSTKKSTDNIEFSAGVGFIGHDYNKLIQCLMELIYVKEENKSYKQDRLKELDETNKLDSLDKINMLNEISSLEKLDIEEIRIGLCKHGDIELPDGKDMRIKIDRKLKAIEDINPQIVEFDFKAAEERKDLIDRVNKAFEEVDIIVSYEGPIDLEGLGDSVFGTLGDLAKSQQNKSGKYLIKIANMVNATAITIPSEEVGSGIVILAKQGIQNGLKAIKLAEKISRETCLPDLYYKYFKNSYLRKKNNLIFKP